MPVGKLISQASIVADLATISDFRAVVHLMSYLETSKSNLKLKLFYQNFLDNTWDKMFEGFFGLDSSGTDDLWMSRLCTGSEIL